MTKRYTIKIPSRVLHSNNAQVPSGIHGEVISEAVNIAFGDNFLLHPGDAHIFTCTAEQYLAFFIPVRRAYKKIPDWLHNVREYQDGDDGVYMAFEDYGDYKPRQDEVLIAVTAPANLLNYDPETDWFYEFENLIYGSPRRYDQDMTIICSIDQVDQMREEMDIQHFQMLRQNTYLASDYLRMNAALVKDKGTRHYVVDNAIDPDRPKKEESKRRGRRPAGESLMKRVLADDSQNPFDVKG